MPCFKRVIDNNERMENRRMDKDYYAEVGEMLRNARIKKGFTQSDVARLLGYSSAQFISNAERGLCRLPLEAISRLIRLYEMDFEAVIQEFLKVHEEHYRNAFNANSSATRLRKRARAKRS